jgi:hypothetical protein
MSAAEAAETAVSLFAPFSVFRFPRGRTGLSLCRNMLVDEFNRCYPLALLEIGKRLPLLHVRHHRRRPATG